MFRNILLTIEYDGTNFSGWQRQPNARTVQGELERVLSTLCAQDIKIDGTSRTDAGVHAYGQRATFSGDFSIPTENIKRAANNMLAGERNTVSDVRIVKAEEVKEGFHARFDCKGKEYIYVINTGEPSVFLKDREYFVDSELDFEEMKKASAAIVGTHDFACFQAAGGQERETTVRTVYSLDLIKTGSSIKMHIKGDGFLYNMVRIIAGTLVDVGSGKIKASDMEKIIDSKDRTKAGHTAPAQGLYLNEIYFDKNL